MAKKKPVLTTPQRMATTKLPAPSSAQRKEERQAEKARRRLVAGRLGWGGMFGGRSAVEDPGTVYTGPSTQVGAVYPFLLGAGLPPRGVPVGRDVLTGELVCVDPSGWTGTLTTNPGVWVMSQPGAGKSALVKRICLVYASYGHMVVVPGDVKGEYTPLVEALGGSVVRIGTGGQRLNPLDSGPLKHHMATLPTAEREAMQEAVQARRLDALGALLATKPGLGRAPSEVDQSALNRAVELADAAVTGDPIIRDVVNVLREGPQDLRDKLGTTTEERYTDLTRSLIAGLENLCDGPLKGLFDGQTTAAIDLNAPAVSVDISALRARGNDVISAGMIATWAYTYAAVDSARSIGMIKRSLVLPMDEMWRALRSGPGLVDAMDGISRLNRVYDDVTLFVTHSLLDAESLPTEEDRMKARGLMDRCDTWVIGASSTEELERVTGKRALTEQERMMITSWSSATSTGLDGTDQIHPGRGKYLIKIGTRPGIAAATELTAAERRLYHTDNNAQVA
ncbi:ATP-binding protein [Streptomyces sp. NPDC088360]|uniref:ATP-binding protein n=1 Tax=Streptomyces sp. NPDC088360 TaxID=3154515 RepID=UPI00344EABA7